MRGRRNSAIWKKNFSEIFSRITDFGRTQSRTTQSSVSLSEARECRVHQSVCSSSREESGGGREQLACTGEDRRRESELEGCLVYSE